MRAPWPEPPKGAQLTGLPPHDGLEVTQTPTVRNSENGTFGISAKRGPGKVFICVGSSEKWAIFLMSSPTHIPFRWAVRQDRAGPPPHFEGWEIKKTCLEAL